MSRTTAIRLLFAALAVGFFAAPIAARALGITAEAFENRRFAEAPKLSQGWDAFQQTTAFLTDRMPLRAQAVRANTRIWTDVFGSEPRYADGTLGGDAALPFAGSAGQPDAPGAALPGGGVQVLAGRDGWLFLQDELNRACGPPIPFEQALARWRALVATIRASGRDVVLIVAPDKASVYPEHLPASYVSDDCALAAKRRLWRLFDGGGVVELRDALVAQKASAGDDLYARKDSHWTTLGSLSLVRAALAQLGTGIRVSPGEITDPGRASYQGDLTVLIGNPENDTRAERAVTRAAGAPRVPGRTVLVGDSFSNAPIGQLRSYFAEVAHVLWVGTPIDELAGRIAGADTVILETVERELSFRAADDGPVPKLQRALRAGLDSQRSR
jgi:hypothetical protein